MSQPSPDARAVVRAVEALTTQVRRIADALSTPVVRYEVAADDAPTTPATTCSAQYHGYGLPRLCIRAAQHEHPRHTDESGFHWSDDVAVYPTDSTVRIAHWHPRSEQLAGERQELAGMVGEFIDAQLQQARAADEDERCLTHFHGACDGTTRDCAFPTPGTGRRRRLRVLLNRLNNGIPLTPDEAQLLTRHVTTEICDANDGRKEAERLGRMVDEYSAGARQLSEKLKTERQRSKIFETELRVLRAGLRANGADPTQIQNLWAQIRLRNRQWRETKRELAVTRSMLEAEGGDVSLVDEMVSTVAKAEREARDAQATVERVRALLPRDPRQDEAIVRVSYPQLRAALDGAEQPTEPS